MENIKFESAVKRLEEIVNKLEAGDLSLDDSIKLFEEGVRLYQVCIKRLDEAEKKVEILLKDKDGNKMLKSFQMENAEEV
ncbi:MAG: exodeoxyribonuclease VII small subunit [Nitrospirota bacterium]